MKWLCAGCVTCCRQGWECLEYDALLWVQDKCFCGRNAAAVGVKEVDVVQEPAFMLVIVWLPFADSQKQVAAMQATGQVSPAKARPWSFGNMRGIHIPALQGRSLCGVGHTKGLTWNTRRASIHAHNCIPRPATWPTCIMAQMRCLHMYSGRYCKSWHLSDVTSILRDSCTAAWSAA